MIVPAKTDRSARDLPPWDLAMIEAAHAAHLRERFALGRLLADADL